MEIAIENKPFVKYNLEEDKDKPDTFTVRLNKEERAIFDEDKRLMKQTKDSTAMKQLAEIGHFVLHDSLFNKVIKTLLDNKRKNERLGIDKY